MGLATEARRVLEKLPPGLREGIESSVSFLPRSLLYGHAFRATTSMLKRAERRPAEEWRAAQDRRVRDLIAYAYERVPYYRSIMDDRGLKPKHMRGVSDLKHLPLLDRKTLESHETELLAKGVWSRSREKVTTGGTSGQPLQFWIDRNRSGKEWAFMTWQWRRAGYRVGARRAILRGAELKGASRGRLHEWHPLLDELVLSTFRLSQETLPQYLALLDRYRPEFLHGYPSSAEVFGQLLENVPPARRPRFRALLLGSENLYAAQRDLLQRAFRCRVFAWYGHSEKCLLAAQCEMSTDYHFFPEYGVLEVLDEKGEPVPPGGNGTIVGTGFMNRAMPFLRYVTDDRGTVAEGACECGRTHPRLSTIEGRWNGERLFGAGGETFAFTALNTHSRAFERVMRFKVRQERPGEAEILVQPRPGFNAKDEVAIAADYGSRAADTVRFTVRVVEDLPLTVRGKFKFVEQLIPEDVQTALLNGRDGRGEVA